MTFQILFIFSGAVILLLISAKLWEMRRKKQIFALALLSKGDERVRTLSHEAAQYYSAWKGKAEFFLNKQLPLHTKNFINKTNALVKEKALEYIGDIRGSRFLKKNEGISEFFQALEEKEEGRIDDTLDSMGDDTVK
ncbi:hypothetical protein KW785_02220 [Candidatus Parcubacteria bacterium]|nr:hypothetical protein [Candidatus Parcubacteria bacterium]